MDTRTVIIVLAVVGFLTFAGFELWQQQEIEEGLCATNDGAVVISHRGPYIIREDSMELLSDAGQQLIADLPPGTGLREDEQVYDGRGGPDEYQYFVTGNISTDTVRDALEDNGIAYQEVYSAWVEDDTHLRPASDTLQDRIAELEEAPAIVPVREDDEDYAIWNGTTLISTVREEVAALGWPGRVGVSIRDQHVRLQEGDYTVAVDGQDVVLQDVQVSSEEELPSGQQEMELYVDGQRMAQRTITSDGGIAVSIGDVRLTGVEDPDVMAARLRHPSRLPIAVEEPLCV